MKYFFYMIVCLALAGCTPATPTILHVQRMQQAPPAERGPVNDHGSTQLAGIHNHGSMQVYINSQAPGSSVVPGDNNQAIETNPSQATDPWQAVKERIKKAEGLRLKPYMLEGDLHIGYGLNLSGRGVTKAEMENIFDMYLFPEALADVQSVFPGWSSIPKPVQEVLIEMRYQMSPDSFRGFDQTIAAVNAGDYNRMASEMRNSDWWKNELTHDRAERLAQAVIEYAGGI